MPKRFRGYHKIIVDDRRFRWKCDFAEPAEKFSAAYAENGDRWEPDRLIVRLEESPHCTLTVTWPACEGPTVLPSFVRTCILTACQRGWLVASRAISLSGPDIECDSHSPPDGSAK